MKIEHKNQKKERNLERRLLFAYQQLDTQMQQEAVFADNPFDKELMLGSFNEAFQEEAGETETENEFSGLWGNSATETASKIPIERKTEENLEKQVEVMTHTSEEECRTALDECSVPTLKAINSVAAEKEQKSKKYSEPIIEKCSAKCNEYNQRRVAITGEESANTDIKINNFSKNPDIKTDLPVQGDLSIVANTEVPSSDSVISSESTDKTLTNQVSESASVIAASGATSQEADISTEQIGINNPVITEEDQITPDSKSKTISEITESEEQSPQIVAENSETITETQDARVSINDAQTVVDIDSETVQDRDVIPENTNEVEQQTVAMADPKRASETETIPNSGDPETVLTEEENPETTISQTEVGGGMPTKDSEVSNADDPLDNDKPTLVSSSQEVHKTHEHFKQENNHRLSGAPGVVHNYSGKEEDFHAKNKIQDQEFSDGSKQHIQTETQRMDVSANITNGIKHHEDGEKIKISRITEEDSEGNISEKQITEKVHLASLGAASTIEKKTENINT